MRLLLHLRHRERLHAWIMRCHHRVRLRLLLLLLLLLLLVVL